MINYLKKSAIAITALVILFSCTKSNDEFEPISEDLQKSSF